MEKFNLKPNYYFVNLEHFKHNALFSNANYVWEVLHELKNYIDHYGDIRNTEIPSNVVIEGPVIIGKNCTIMPGAFIRPYTIIGDNCTVGHCAEIKHSIIMDNAKVQSFTFVGDSIIGDSARIGSGTITANRRFDQKNIGIKLDGEYFNYETDFFGCIIGDESRIGANCTTLPGTLIGKDTWVTPMNKIKGFIASDKVIDGENVMDKERVKLK